MEQTYDYSDHQDAASYGDNSLGALRSLAAQQVDLEYEIGRLEAQLVERREQLRMISEVRLPELMDELGVENFETSDGAKIEIKEIVHASMGRSLEEKTAALDWLESNGHGALIKRTVEVPFGRGQDGNALGLAAELQHKGINASFQRKVEPMTLKAFVVEELESGRNIPLDLFKVHRLRTSRVKFGR